MPTPLENLALSIKRLQHRNYRTLDARLAPLGISLVQWGALREIERNPGLCMHGLAEITFNSDQAFGTLMTRLLRQKLVARQPGAGRANVHHLTPRGKTLLAEGHKRVRQVLTKTFAPLDANECARLQSLITKVLGEETLDTAPCFFPAPHRPRTRALEKKATRRAPSARSRKTMPRSAE